MTREPVYNTPCHEPPQPMCPHPMGVREAERNTMQGRCPQCGAVQTVERTARGTWPLVVCAGTPPTWTQMAGDSCGWRGGVCDLLTGRPEDGEVTA